MADGGGLFVKRASQEKELSITLFEQAIHCYEAAIFYYSELKQIPHTASCYINLANTRKKLLMSCEVNDSEIQQKRIVAEASAALIYYQSTDQAEIIAQLQGLISEFSPKEYPAKYFNILSDAEVVFKNYRFFPERVTIPGLISTQILLERVIADLSKDDVDMRKQCHSSLVKVHYTLAMRTKSYESAQDHLSEALENLRLAELGTTKKSQDLLSAASHHMRGKVLLQYKKNKAEALSALGQAYAIYQQYERQEAMDAITQIAPDITANEDNSSTNINGCK
jgi:tetratricopeptide (TPR) repeat protein